MKTNQKSQKPYAVYVVEEGDNAYWTKIGAAWRHEDGKGFNISLSWPPGRSRAEGRRGTATSQAVCAEPFCCKSA
jgi:hypothetical protein